MIIGRLLGWMLIGLAVIMASADAVLALGPTEASGIVTADVVTLLSGRPPEALPVLGATTRAGDMLREMPAWVLVGMLGIATALVCRKRPRRRRLRSH